MTVKEEFKNKLEKDGIPIGNDELNELTEMYIAFTQVLKEERISLEDLDPLFHVEL